MGEELAKIIREEIRQKGPIPFSRWMELCLYHPQYGYYMKSRPEGRRITGPGRDADFVTPPTLHPFFGEAIGKELKSAWEAAGRPSPFVVLEFGGGEGGLARDAVRWIDAACPDLASSVRWTHVEVSDGHRRAQAARPDARFAWASASELRTFTFDALVLCEVIDAVPCNLAEFRQGAWHQRAVGVLDGQFVWTTLPAVAAPEKYFAKDWNQPLVGEEGLIALDQFPREYFLDAALYVKATGRIIVADYGDAGDRLRDGPALDLVRGYRGHALVDDVLAAPGDVDITIPVDFDMVASALSATVFDQTSIESLESFLLRHGILDALNAIDRSTVEGASSYLRLRQLLLPTGMGAAFKVQRFDRAATKA